MRIDRVVLEHYSVGLRIPLVTARGVISERHGLMFGAESDAGIIGFGEIAPLIGFSGESLDEVYPLAALLRRRLVGRPVPSQLSELQFVFPGRREDRALFPSVALGIDTLAIDLASRGAGCSFARWINPHARDSVPVNAILSGTIDQIRKQIDEKAPHGYQTYKLKIGVEDESTEKDKVAFLRDTLGPDVSIRLDANRTFGCDQAVRFLRDVAPYDIEYIEEPLMAELLNHLSDLRKESSIPIALDESLSDRNIGNRSWSLHDRCRHFVELGAIDVAIVKPMLAGGVSEVVSLGDDLSQSGIKMVMTSAIETGIGFASCLHFAAALPAVFTACGFDTLGLLDDTLINEQLLVRDGSILIPSGHGLGVTYRGARARSEEGSKR